MCGASISVSPFPASDHHRATQTGRTKTRHAESVRIFSLIPARNGQWPDRVPRTRVHAAIHIRIYLRSFTPLSLICDRLAPSTPLRRFEKRKYVSWALHERLFWKYNFFRRRRRRCGTPPPTNSVFPPSLCFERRLSFTCNKVDASNFTWSYRNAPVLPEISSSHVHDAVEQTICPPIPVLRTPPSGEDCVVDQP